MRSSKYTGVLISVLLIAALLLIFTDPWSTLRKEGKRIILKDRSAIDRILIWDLYDSIHLIKQNQSWYLFGTEKVNQVAVDNLLFAAERLHISSVITLDKGSGNRAARKLRYYKGEKVQVAYDFQMVDDQYLITPQGSDQSYYITVSGHAGRNLDKVFSSSANHFREHLLMDLVPSEVSLVEIELDSGEAFRLVRNEEDEIACYSMNSTTQLPSGKLDDLSVRLLFSYFTSIRYDQPAGIGSESLLVEDRISSRLARLHVETIGGEKHTLQVFPFYETTGAEAHMFKALVLHNENPEALIINYLYLDVLMRDLSHYFGEK